ncbi:LacI family DNA-binding transcriptional regulator [Glycomyces buryatensis]|uniref:LacI family transcriptional regulator n=1 Tax=Glycomyces buryatensis TaxID=2570927 RepID=A0A4S8QBE3_9ACTN|nr:LacI family DNA-binding transcriptional regulator [Glycomyces buryatensis]THV41853.1 LacI family transcriptional regulator [Glycomyces buryatensis]
MERKQPARLADVARAAGVSVATASRVLNGSPHRVSDQLSERVREAARRLRYAPNVGAQVLARATSQTVALLLHDVTDPYFGQIAGGVLAEASRRGVRVLIADTGIDPDSEIQHLDSLRGYRPRAVIVAGSRTTDEAAEERLADHLADLLELGANVVSVGQPGLPGRVVRPGNREGAAALARHLVELGHHDFALVSGPEQLQVVRERRDGFISALPTDANVVHVASEFTRDGGYRAGRMLLDRPDLPTAVFVTGDVQATGLCTALREGGVRIPDEVSVAGFDDIPVVRDLTPSLTTVALPLHDMGVKALEAALEEGADYPDELSIEAELIERDSTAAPRK